MSMRPQVRLYFEGDERKRHQRSATATARCEPYWSVAVYSLRTDCTEGEYEWWDGTEDFTLPNGTRFSARFEKHWDAMEFARKLAEMPRAELERMHDVRDAAFVVIQDHNGKEFGRHPLLKVVPAPKRKPWWMRMFFGWK